jgi:hypothetical protein
LTSRFNPFNFFTNSKLTWINKLWSKQFTYKVITILAVDRLTLACHKPRGRRGRRRQHRPRPRPRLPYFTNQLCRCLQIYLFSVITLIWSLHIKTLSSRPYAASIENIFLQNNFSFSKFQNFFSWWSLNAIAFSVITLIVITLHQNFKSNSRLRLR